MKNCPVIVLFIATLTQACTTGLDGETVVGSPGSAYWLNSASPKTQRDYFFQVCSGYGYANNTQQMTDCIAEEARAARATAATGSTAPPPDFSNVPYCQRSPYC